MPPISFRPMKPGEEAGAVDFVLSVFTEFVAPQFSQEGIAEFKKFICADAFAERLSAGNIILLAESGPKIVGIIEMRENSHIALLFVESLYQCKGIGKELIRRSIEICRNRRPDIKKITVNSSPNAYNAYKKYGFRGIDDEKVKNGIRFIPMALILDNNGGIPEANSTESKGRATD